MGKTPKRHVRGVNRNQDLQEWRRGSRGKQPAPKPSPGGQAAEKPKPKARKKPAREPSPSIRLEEIRKVRDKVVRARATHENCKAAARAAKEQLRQFEDELLAVVDQPKLPLYPDPEAGQPGDRPAPGH